MTTIDLTGDKQVQKFLNIIKGSAESRIVRTAIGEGGTDDLRNNFYEKDKVPNQLGGKRTHFYRQAGDSTGYDLTPEGATVFATKLGIMQRWKGGYIQAKPGGWLTIPIDAEAHGKRAREFTDLEVRGRFLVDSTDKALYVLKKRVWQDGDPTVVPSNKVLQERARKRVQSTVELLLQRN